MRTPLRHSLVAQLTVLIAAIITLSFMAIVAVVHRSTTDTFVEAQNEILAGSSPLRDDTELVRTIGSLTADRGLDAVRPVAANPTAFGLKDQTAFLVVDATLAVVATTEPILVDAQVTQDARGALEIVATADTPDGVATVNLAAAAPDTLRSGDGTPVGFLVILPRPMGRAEASRFAFAVWRATAGWLVLVVLAAMTATAWVMRRSLSPIDRLTSAARQLQDGAFPGRVEVSGGSEFTQLIEAFNAAAEAITRTDGIRRQLVADVAHELRTPVTNLKGQLEALAAGLIPPNREFTETIEAEVRLLERLIEDFQQLAETDAGQMRIRLQVLPLKETLAGIVAQLIDMAGAHLTNDIADGLWLQADEERLRQIFANLMENSSRHQPAGLRIRLSSRQDAGSVTIVFADNGPGVAQVDQPFIFQRFYRAEKSRNRASGGAGLGLAIVRGIVEAMNGTIRYDDGENGGAAFAITLPRASAP